MYASYVQVEYTIILACWLLEFQLLCTEIIKLQWLYQLFVDMSDSLTPIFPVCII